MTRQLDQDLIDHACGQLGKIARKHVREGMAPASAARVRVTSESPRFVRGVEVDAEGDEVVPRGAHQRLRIVERARVRKTVPMRMNNKYATLEIAPAGSRKKVASPEIKQLRKDARMWWQIARAEGRAGFRGSVDSMLRAIAIENKLIALGETPPRRPKGYED